MTFVRQKVPGSLILWCVVVFAAVMAIVYIVRPDSVRANEPGNASLAEVAQSAAIRSDDNAPSVSIKLPVVPVDVDEMDIQSAFDGWAACLEENGIVITGGQLVVSPYGVRASMRSDLAESLRVAQANGVDIAAYDVKWFDGMKLQCKADYAATRTAWSAANMIDPPDDVAADMAECWKAEDPGAGAACEHEIRTELERSAAILEYSIS